MTTNKKIPDTRARNIKKCVFCDKGVGACGAIDFFVLSLDRFVFNDKAIQRQHGLETMLGHPAIATIMGTDSQMGIHLDGVHDVWVCAECCYGQPVMLFNALGTDENEEDVEHDPIE